MRCAICGHAMLSATESIVSTTMGDFVHIHCADRDALVAYRLRTRRAITSTVLAIGLLGLAACAEIDMIRFLVLLVMLAVSHVRLNALWWRATLPPPYRRRR